MKSLVSALTSTRACLWHRHHPGGELLEARFEHAPDTSARKVRVLPLCKRENIKIGNSIFISAWQKYPSSCFGIGCFADPCLCIVWSEPNPDVDGRD